MEYLFNKWKRIKKIIKDREIFLFLDYDGTLSPIAKTPQKAILPDRIRKLLADLSKMPAVRIAVVSGRALDDIKDIIKIKNIIYAGNHGLEIEGDGVKFQYPVTPLFFTVMQCIKNKLEGDLCRVKGLLIEDKELSLSVHYRLVKKSDVNLVKGVFRNTVNAFKDLHIVKINKGKKVFELLPAVNWDKGSCVLWIIKKTKKQRALFPIYIGDDVTDEDAFNAVGSKGLAVFIGSPKKSYARYYLKNTEDVYSFLIRLRQSALAFGFGGREDRDL